MQYPAGGACPEADDGCRPSVTADLGCLAGVRVVAGAVLHCAGGQDGRAAARAG